MPGKLDGQVAVITGAAQGQGAAEAALFAAEGARVAVADVQEDAGRAIAAEIGDAARFYPLDVSDPDAWARTIDDVVRQWGRLDVLVNNAGIGRPTPVLTATVEEYLAVFRVNELGVFLGTQAAARQMIRARSGSIINVSSTDGFVGQAPLSAYTASKFAVRGLTRTAAIELGPLGIRVNSIHPGWIETPMVAATPDMIERASRSLSRNPIPRMGKPSEAAQAALFLASDDSSFCTGAELCVDGGMLAGGWVPMLRKPTLEAAEKLAAS
ncbi:SDR family NAD(P)-dependent oxidoreductase [Amycolatopsis sp. GM8]|uniref:SDR family NAD(P)-dependent oxidoreductase n=1 Tax=Amycolatopsis sp. GM8 TaxID=2896530 RepID=UPI001EFFDD59|nr:glucose 1-dehydrogenase [Amycolatopsis sp. GM8]